MSETALPQIARPDWLPVGVRLYLDHVASGLTLRELARREGRAASTVLRQVRRTESRRDDPLLDEALSVLAEMSSAPDRKDTPAMSAPIRMERLALDDTLIAREGRRVLRRLAEPGTLLAVAPEMEKAAVLKTLPDGTTLRAGVVDRAVAQAFAVKDWIAVRRTGRVTSYEITTAGRSALKRLQAEEESAGLAEAPAAFGHQHRDWDERAVAGDDGVTRLRVNSTESPVAMLGRKKDKDGKPFLEADLVRAAERLREDFEVAQMGPRVAQNWDRFLTAGDRGGFRSDSGLAEGPRGARDRVAAALRGPGAGVGDVALGVCCFLEGIETAERRMGWAARSGKVVLRIALMRLKRHYDETYGRSGPLIG